MPNPTIPSGTTVTATLSLDSSASGSAVLMIAHPSAGDCAGVAPSATGSVSITPIGTGILRIHVDMNEQADTGELTVSPGDIARKVKGDDNESFIVLEAREP